MHGDVCQRRRHQESITRSGVVFSVFVCMAGVHELYIRFFGWNKGLGPRKVAEPFRGVFEHTPVSTHGQPVEQAWASWPEVVFGVNYKKVVVNFCGETFVYKKTRLHSHLTRTSIHIHPHRHGAK